MSWRRSLGLGTFFDMTNIRKMVPMRFFELKKYICFLEPLLLLQSAGKHYSNIIFAFFIFLFVQKKFLLKTFSLKQILKCIKSRVFFFRRFSVSDIIWQLQRHRQRTPINTDKKYELLQPAAWINVQLRRAKFCWKYWRLVPSMSILHFLWGNILVELVEITKRG